MGIPSYFSYIVKNHLQILQKVTCQTMPVHNLYMDCNSIIYDAVYRLNANYVTEQVADQIIAKAIETIAGYIRVWKPANNVMIAFDGVAPVAKLEQQRSRRFKSQYINTMTRSVLNSEEAEPWNTSAITPGTYFMKQLDEKVKLAFEDPRQWGVSRILFSGSREVGEGEHKIFEYIRQCPSEHNHDQNTIIYGLDADLIMLSIHHLPISKNLYLFRETPEFIKSINVELEPNANYLLDIPQLARSIVEEMSNGQSVTEEQMRNTIYDYIFMCFMLGNDFMPHFPALNIRTGGIHKLLQTYKDVIGGTNHHLTDGTRIVWQNMRMFIKQLADNEHAFLKQEHKLRDRKEKHAMPNGTPEERLEYFKQLPSFDRSIEKYINPFRENWQVRYYKSLFELDEVSEERIKQICINYLEGLEWTMKYYTSGCPDWRWKYQYNYPPLLCDLIRYVPMFDTTFMPEKGKNAVSDLVQMCYVLPRNSLDFLPKKLSEALVRMRLDWYQTDCAFHWAYCKYFWESHPDLPHLDIEKLERFVEHHMK